jgi:protein-L-isoaspartate(D-aspartate) O-methyltransferase
MNFEQARYNMIEQQVRPWDVLSGQVLAVMSDVAREDFVPTDKKEHAYSDVRLPIGENQCMMHPGLEGRMLQALDVNDTDEVLEIGTGSAYITACLASLAKSVVSIDIHPEFTQHAEKMLAAKDIQNVTLETADATQASDDKKQYDIVVITGSLERVPEHLKQKMKIKGRMFVITGSEKDPIMQANLVVRHGENEWLSTSLFETYMAPLENQKCKTTFSL